MKKLVVDKDRCIGCGACVSIDSEDFMFDDDGLSEVVNEIIEIENENLVDAIETCPTEAIELKDES